KNDAALHQQAKDFRTMQKEIAEEGGKRASKLIGQGDTDTEPKGKDSPDKGEANRVEDVGPRKCLDGWLAAIKSSDIKSSEDAGGEFWDDGKPHHGLISPRGGEVLKVSVTGETASAKVRINGSTIGGSPYTVTCDVFLVKTNGRWKITALENRG